ncbi:MAG: citramalate synthase [Candidatus Hydrogenedentota bacterium]
MNKISDQHVAIYDTTLRDGTQAEGISISVDDKVRIARRLDAMGVHYLEGGWPGSNPNSIEFFDRIRGMKLHNMKVASFGSTRHVKNTCAKDGNIQALLATKTPVVTIFGKSWDLHVRDALRISLEENLEIIEDSVAYLKKSGKEVIYDAEHFFDAFKRNRSYALASVEAATRAGADCLCLCETNGGAIPNEVSAIMREVRQHIPGIELGIHTHNDSGCGVANALAGIAEGATHVQGTINGIGERCGNANLVPIIANLELKMNRTTIGRKNLKRLNEIARFVWELTNQIPDERAPYVGKSAFAHKGGIHVSAVLRNAATYEHIVPELVGNKQRVLVSDQSGKSNLVYKIKELGLKVDPSAPELISVLKDIKALENEGYEFEGAEASFVLMIETALGRVPEYFSNVTWRILDEYISGENFVIASVHVNVAGKEIHTDAEGAGPFNALDKAFRAALRPTYPQIDRMKLVDYKVRILHSEASTAERVRVLIMSSDDKETWGTVGVSSNLLEASWTALLDSILYYLHKRLRMKSAKGKGQKAKGKHI